MQKLKEQTLKEIERRFRTNKGYTLSEQNPIYCPQVNGLVNICLNELGLISRAHSNCQDQLNGTFNKEWSLFHSEVDTEGRITNVNFNSGKNAISSLALATCGLKEEANYILDALKNTGMYDSKTGLFMRELNPMNGTINPLSVTQTNFWMVLALAKLERGNEAKHILKSLEGVKYDDKTGLFLGQDCRFLNSKSVYYVDDQAIAILTYTNLGEQKKARDLLNTILESPLYDRQTGLFNSSFSDSNVDSTKSTYKNSFMAQALAKLGYSEELAKLQKGLIRELYDFEEKLFNQTTKDKTKVPDNSALALVALENLF